MSEILDPNSLDAYDYELPSELIANFPTFPKEEARLLVYERAGEKISHLKFGDLPQILPPCDIIFNDTKVVKARIYGKKQSGGETELLLNSPLADGKFSVYIKGKVRAGSVLNFAENLVAEVCELFDDGLRTVKFSQNGELLDAGALYEILSRIGRVPLPPYIKRSDVKDDESWYQSVFAKNEGAVAAPTASLHFSDEMMTRLAREREIFYLTLHVGAGTFKGVESADIARHKMHAEFYDIPQDTQNLIRSDRPILGVGTTVTRCVEEFVRSGVARGECKLFLNLNNKPIRQNYLLTNFHLPKSTLIMLVTSFIGLEATMRIYNEAVAKGYKFYSYGDAMLVI